MVRKIETPQFIGMYLLRLAFELPPKSVARSLSETDLFLIPLPRL